MNYYNEFDKKSAAWLRELIKRKLIPAGEVDERSIADVRADDLAGFVQCHFFAGAGGWPLALRFAGWPEDRPIWTGSCPCQPFSVAGKRKGFKDERDLWPVFFNLIKECKPRYVFGEQVASAEVVGSELEASFLVAVQEGAYARANKLAKQLAASKGFHHHQRWLDRVYTDLETAGYAGRPEVLGAHSVGAPHRRQRLYWGAERVEHSQGIGGEQGLPNTRGGYGGSDSKQGAVVECAGGSISGVADNDGAGFGERGRGEPVSQERATVEFDSIHSLSPWSDFAIINCTDGKIRRVPDQPIFQRMADGVSEGVDGGGTSSVFDHPEEGFPLAQKIEGQNMLLKGYGNAIVPQVAAAFVEEFNENIQRKSLDGDARKRTRIRV